MATELYIEGNQKEIEEVLEFVRERLGVGRINCADVKPRIAPWKKCSCGGDYSIICNDCGDDYEDSEINRTGEKR